MNRYARIALLLVIALLSIGYASALTNNTPTAYYSFNTSLLLDDTGNGNSLTETGTSTQWVTGLAGNASRFFSDNDELQSPVYFNGTNAMSFSAWINPNATNGMVMGQDNGGTYRSWYVYYSSTSKIEFQVTNTAGTNVAATTTATYGTGIGWIHVCGAYDGSNVWLRVNGTTTTNNSASGTLGFGTATSGAIIGNRDQSLPFAGDVDEVAWWVGDAITARDCDELYNNGYPLTYPFTPASGLDNFTVTAQDAYTASSITGFNVTFEDLGITTTQNSYNHTTDFSDNNGFSSEANAVYNSSVWGYQFNGVSNRYVNLNNAIDFETNDFKINITFTVQNFTGTDAVLLSRWGTLANYNLRFAIIPNSGKSSGYLNLNTVSTSGDACSASGGTVNWGQTYNVVGTHTPTNCTIVLNDLLVATDTTVGQPRPVTTDTVLGKEVRNGRYFNGTILHAQIWQDGIEVLNMPFINFSTEPSTFDYSGQGTQATFAGTTYNTTGENMNFNGVNNYIDFNSDSRFDLQTFTIVYEITPYNLGARRDLISKGESSYITSIQASGIPNMWVYDGSYRSLAGTSTFSNGQRQWVAYRYDKTNAVYDIWVNGTEENSADPTAYNALSNNVVNLSFGTKSVTAPTNYFNGLAHQIIIYDYDLSNDELTQLYTTNKTNTTPLFKYTFQNSTVGDITVNGIPNYFGNTTSNVNTSNTFASKHTRYPEALFYDAYTGLNITSFNVTINATVYTTTNGSLYIPYKDLIGVSSANKYFQASNTISNRTEYLAHYASITGFNAYDKVSGLNISTFTVNTTSEGGTATNNTYLPSLYTTYGNFTAEYNKAGYYQSFTTYEANPQTSQSTNFTVFNHKLRVNITTDVGSSSNNTFNITIYSMNYTFTETGETTNGTTSNNLSHGTYMVYVNDTLHTLTNQTITLQEGNNITNITIQVQTSNTFNLFFKNESNNELLSENTTVYLTVIGDVNATNYTFVNNTILIEMLTPDEYEFIYWIDPDVRRSYYITLNEQSFENITLYTIDEDISSFYVPVEVDDKGTRCSNNTVSLLRYYTDINGYRTVEMSRTNTLGQAVLRVVPNIINYKLSFTGSCGDFTTAPTKIIDTTNNYLVAQAQSILYSSQNIGEVLTNITYINSTATYSFTWQDNNNLVTEGCLSVTRRTNGTTKTVHNNCSASSSGSLIYTIPLSDRNNTVFNAKGTIETNSDNNYYYTAQSVDFRNSFAILGATGLWIAILLFSTLVIFSAQSVGTMIITSIIAFAGISWIGIVFSEWTTVIGLAILGAIIIYRSRS